MHEYYLASKIVAGLERIARENRLTKITRVYLRYSVFTGVDPHALGQAMELAGRGTPCEGAELLAQEIHPPGWDELDPAAELKAHEHSVRELDQFLTQDIVIEKVEGETED